MLGRDPIEGLFFTKDLKIQFGPPADLAAAHKWWYLSDQHHRPFNLAGAGFETRATKWAQGSGLHLLEPLL